MSATKVCHVKFSDGTYCTKFVQYKKQSLCRRHVEEKAKGKPFTKARHHRPKNAALLRDDLDNKYCTRCEHWLPESKFNLTPHRVDGLSNYCGQCVRRSNFENKYGITSSQFDEIYDAQNGLCAICRETFDKENLCVDHDHSCCPKDDKCCGKCVRGLLCKHCNSAIGFLRDNVNNAFNAAEYLYYSGSKHCANTVGF